jgi:serine/threonine protein kinase/tetratricopeptide (TPR) repeat protein
MNGLTAERWQQAKAIVADALEQDSAKDRAALIAVRCGGDVELLREVESLVEQPTGSVESFAQNAAELLQRNMSILRPGLRIGAYAIVRELGRGGMGAVYLAQRADGQFEKQVAIKVLKRGTDTDEVLRRFRGEREILARLDHPNIARLVDAGTTDEGLPYFVMDYVDGKPITKYSDEHQLPITRRLDLFRVVCSAVSYAHQNLVIHRDIKPNNVLVTDDGEVRLLDFGIAKLLQEAGADQPNVTVTMLRVMTPEYASPEQVKGEPVTTVSDVYSLGVFLYELLTGNRPYNLKRRTPEEITHAICEQEPERPSTSITRSKGEVHAPEKLRRSLSGDLDNIVLKALRKDPRRRYLSVDQLSEDIRRHLKGLPVRARKDTPAYRASKFVHRHKLGVAAAAFVALALIAGSITTAWQAHEARLEKAKAEQRFNQVRKLAHSLMFDYHDQIAALPGSTQLRQTLVKDSLQYLDSLAQDAGSDLDLQPEIGTAYQRIGDVQGGVITSASGGTLSHSNLGDTQGALTSYRKALVIREKLAALEPSYAEIQQEWGTSITRMGEMSLTLGKPADAAEYFRKAIAIYEKLSAADPADKILRKKLCSLYFVLGKAMGVPGGANLGDGAGALEYLRKALAIDEALAAENPTEGKYRQGLSADYGLIGQVLSNNGNQGEALESYKKGLAIAELLVKENGTSTLYRREVAVQDSNVGNALLALGDKSDAVESCRQAVRIYEALVAADPSDAFIRRDSAVGYRNLADALYKNNDRAGARTNFDKAVTIFQELAAKDPSNALVSYQQSQTYLKFSAFLSDTGDVAGAIENAREAVRIGEELVIVSPNNNSAGSTLALSYFQLGKCNALLAAKVRTSPDKQTDLWSDVRKLYQKSLNLWQEMKRKGTLSGIDADKPDEVTREIANCDAALK